MSHSLTKQYRMEGKSTKPKQTFVQKRKAEWMAKAQAAAAEAKIMSEKAKQANEKANVEINQRMSRMLGHKRSKKRTGSKPRRLKDYVRLLD